MLLLLKIWCSHLNWERSRRRRCVGHSMLPCSQTVGRGCSTKLTMWMITFQCQWACSICWKSCQLLFFLIQSLCSVTAPAPALVCFIPYFIKDKGNFLCRQLLQKEAGGRLWHFHGMLCFFLSILCFASDKKVISSPWVGWYEGNYVLAWSS